MNALMNVLIYPFLALSAAGFAALLAVHVASLFGVAYPFERFAGILVPGIFVVFLPTIFVMNRLTWDFKRKDISARFAARLPNLDVSHGVDDFRLLVAWIVHLAPHLWWGHGFSDKQSSHRLGRRDGFLPDPVCDPVCDRQLIAQQIYKSGPPSALGRISL